MVGEDLATDLMSFGRPVLVLGDPAQLPPVKSASYFTEAAPDAMLTGIHRQAAEIVGRGVLSAREVFQADQVIVGAHTASVQPPDTQAFL